MSKNVIIVGAGLFGSIAATLARKRGHNVTVIDNAEPYAASKASGCVLAPSWLASLSDKQRERGMGVLKALYPVMEVEFQTNVLGRKFKASRVDPLQVLVKPDAIETVTRVVDGGVDVIAPGMSGGYRNSIVLVAAGIWSADLVDMPPVKGLYGASVLFPGHLPLAQIDAYAPYRQAVVFQIRRNAIWFGDGTALIKKTWEAEEMDRISATVSRAAKMLKLVGQTRPKVNIGARPYVEGHKAGYFARVGAKTWVSTGGAKNGTLLAADQAARFIEEAKL